ncbi:unnamed protein product [Protopolystoma xenopodis]|uniref:Uncharacterized protein n=1 Tax=Protopolystoma xenopodis TaxID=117903 RepID=A0A3S5B916_9PLAT|nr:unnamed protein product [Protopolystoma xenopodis]
MEPDFSAGSNYSLYMGVTEDDGYLPENGTHFSPSEAGPSFEEEAMMSRLASNKCYKQLDPVPVGSL